MAGIAARSYRSAFASILEAEVLAGRDAAFFAERFRRSRRAPAGSPRMTAAPVGFCLVTRRPYRHAVRRPASHRRRAPARHFSPRRRRDGATTLECFADNHPARRFYERHGWNLTHSYERVFGGRNRGFVLFEKARAGTPPRSG